MNKERDLRNQARAARQGVFDAQAAISYAKATDNDDAATAAQGRLEAAEAALVVVQAEQRALKVEPKPPARLSKPITVRDLNNAVARILKAIAVQSSRSEPV